VQEAARILGVPLHTQTDAESLPSSTAPLSHTARLDFVLRWLLDKYSTQPEACQCLPSWILLRRILERMPSVALAKSLSAANPLNTCSKALAHLFPSSPVQTNLDNGKQSNKKRKRQSTSIESPSNGQHSALIFDEITASIRLLILRSTPIASATDSASEDRVHALLRLEHADLVNFVKNTLLGLINLQSSQDLPASLVASSMTLIQDLSILQPNAAVDSSDISFCIECLWPAALLLRFLHLQSDSTDVSQQQHVQQSIKALDRFLATHLFVPARVAFLNTQAPKQKKRPQTELPGLVQRLEPLRSEIATLLGAERSDLVKQGRLSSAYGCVPLLLDLAVRCAPIANPKQRIAEAPWIHALFTALSDTITSSNVSSDAVIINQTLNRMLDVLTSKSLVLDADILVNILNQRCNLLPSSGASEQPDFPLVERILSMNSGIFTGVNSDAAKALFHALTAYRGTNSSTVFKSVTTDDWSNPRVVCYKIAVPLMQAYARTRNLPAFFDHWFTCLSDQAYAASSGCILWADSSLEESLRSILETSLTSMQISELLQSRSDALKQSIASSSDANSQIFANTVLLSAIVGAVKTDATIDSLVPHLESLLSVVQSAFVKITDISDLLSLHLLSLCSQIYHLWYPIWSTSHSSEEVQTRNTLLLEGPVTQYALTRLQKSFNKNIDIPAGNVTGVDSAFVFIASICDMQTRLTGHESDYARLFCRAVLPSEAGDKSRGYVSKRPTAFLITLTGFPELLTCIPTSERIKLFQDLFNSFFNESSVSSSVLNEFLDVVFAASDLSTKDDLFTVVCGSIESAGASGLWLQILLQWPLKAFSRQQREKILDIIVSSLSQEKFDGATKQQAMELIVGLLEVPNATAGISTRPATLVEIAGLPLTRVELSAFEDICKCLLRHILDTKEQDRSKSYLEQLSTLVSKFIVKQKDLSLPSAPGRVWLLNALFEVTETRLTEEELSSLPHRSSSTIDSFVKRLWEVLSSSTDDTSSNKDDQEKAQLAVEAFISVPASILQAGGSSTDKCK
jgi:nucleolar pre-ribosomal-associated protein 2